MSATDDTYCGTGDGALDPDCRAVPEFDLDWRVDDPVDPGTVTVHPADPEDETTEWLSVDVDHAVPLEDAQ